MMPTGVTTTDRGVIKANVTQTAVFTIDRDVTKVENNNRQR